ncbi:IclR family transcriptional regulator [Paramicrobacterium chengjingii]|uniref:IclR family transcriptional regulator n=1 Tax=Paramicrobacterium chengjingii TaxID=2769067 RepID=A0ABX6YJJ2_9MICO|nr:IclR family transcriptional regulator [Microbacterium chengjingii]QPZ38764.1 IclR family transcriptional regulator [Microbacterium chengjingii]
MRDTGSVQSVDRAVQILEMLARDGEVGVAGVARELGVHNSTASRLISALSAHELVERMAGTRRVRLGVGVLRLAGATAFRLDVSTQAQPVCDTLSDDLGETVNVAVLTGEEAINVCQAQGSSAVATQNWVGQRTVLHATSSGKVLLAYLDDDERETRLTFPLDRFTQRTLTSEAELRGELETVRKNGWAGAIEELETGLNAVAAPIRRHDGSVIAAISVAGPTYRLSPERVPDVAVAVVRAGDAISRRMGYRGAAEEF